MSRAGQVETRHREHALSDVELRAVRVMIAERSYDEARARFLGTTWKRARVIVVSFAAVGVFTMQLVTVLIAARGGK